ncbi:MAG TPA: hypothetical protein VFQ35_06680, partial [Polyangiaceae bacterium]|nr:hypothetical protein [Polyangiaceae bacterium]
MIRHALFTAAASIAIALPAAAQTAPEASALSLSWVRGEGAEGCIDRRALMHAVRARLGRDPFADEAERGIEGEITRQGEKFVATLRVRAENGLELGQRRLEGP